MATPKITFPTKAKVCEFVNSILSIAKNERKQDIPENLKHELISTTKAFVNKWFAEVPDDLAELNMLQEEAAEAKANRPKPTWVVLKVDDEQAYVFTTCLAIHKPESDPYAEFAPHEIGIEAINARIKCYIAREARDNKKAAVFKSLGDFLEFGSKKRLKEWGLILKTKLPCYIMPVDPDISQKVVILTIGKDNDDNL